MNYLEQNPTIQITEAFYERVRKKLRRLGSKLRFKLFNS